VIGPRAARAWPARSAGQYARAGHARSCGPVKPKTSVVSFWLVCFISVFEVTTGVPAFVGAPLVVSHK